MVLKYRSFKTSSKGDEKPLVAFTVLLKVAIKNMIILKQSMSIGFRLRQVPPIC